MYPWVCHIFFRLQSINYQGILKATVSGVFQDLKFEISEGLDQNWAELGQLQFWSEPSEILNLWSSNTPKTATFNIP